jgi:beta-xylosidase
MRGLHWVALALAQAFTGTIFSRAELDHSNGELSLVCVMGFRNPILPGFNPDPSITRVGNDYFIVTSTFEWFPGVPVYHSKDL